MTALFLQKSKESLLSCGQLWILAQTDPPQAGMGALTLGGGSEKSLPKNVMTKLSYQVIITLYLTLFDNGDLTSERFS